METESSVLPTIDIEKEDQIEYASHDHPLTLSLCEIDENCSICRERCLGGKTYGCNQCGLFVHESCTKIQIPQEIDHYFHPHPLRLTMKERRYLCCKACNDSLPGLMFECHGCRFYMDVDCALLPTKMKQDGCTIEHIEHFNHGHPLILCDDENKYENKYCFGCQGGLSTRPRFSYDDTLLLPEGSESIYGCLHKWCEFFLHERCARLPPKIDSPYHPGHSLILTLAVDFWTSSTPILVCQGCGQHCVNRCSYQCRGSCNFILGVECAFLRMPILELHSEEYLTLFPRVNPILTCQVCEKTCDGSNIFRCVEHDYNLHLHCGPMPCSIKDKCHIDPLKLMDAFVEDGYEDDIVYCDVCEQPRDPDQCVYYCKDCNFFAEVKCVEAEVLRSLNGERGNVKLRSANKTRIQVGAKLISNVITDNVETDSDNDTENIGEKYLEVEELDENFLSACYTVEECEQLMKIFTKARVGLNPSTPILEESYKARVSTSFFPFDNYVGAGAYRSMCASVSISSYHSICEHVVPSRRSQFPFDWDSSNASAYRFMCAHIEGYALALRENYKLETSLVCSSSDEESDNDEKAIAEQYSDDFKQLTRGLDSWYQEKELLDVFFRTDYNIVRIGEHKIAQHLAYVLKGLLHKYGDFAAKSKLSERLKVIFLTMFCKVIRSMCLTNVREVDEQVLWKWWKILKLVQHAGFEIQFASDHLYEVVQAFFGMDAMTSYGEMRSRVDKISNDIEEKEGKLEAMKRELEAKKRELEELKSDVEQRKYAIEYQSSSVIKNCLKHVSKLKWKKAWDGSPIMFR